MKRPAGATHAGCPRCGRWVEVVERVEGLTGVCYVCPLAWRIDLYGAAPKQPRATTKQPRRVKRPRNRAK